MNFKLSKSSIDKLIGVHPALVLVISRALLYSPIDFGIVQGVRTQEYQNSLYEQGRSKPGNIVTWTKNSRHIGGFGIDFAAYVNGKLSWELPYYKDISESFKKASKELNIPIICGIDWKTPDSGHVELDAAFYPAVKA